MASSRAKSPPSVRGPEAAGRWSGSPVLLCKELGRERHGAGSLDSAARRARPPVRLVGAEQGRGQEAIRERMGCRDTRGTRGCCGHRPGVGLRPSGPGKSLHFEETFRAPKRPRDLLQVSPRESKAVWRGPRLCSVSWESLRKGKQGGSGLKGGSRRGCYQLGTRPRSVLGRWDGARQPLSGSSRNSRGALTPSKAASQRDLAFGVVSARHQFVPLASWCSLNGFPERDKPSAVSGFPRSVQGADLWSDPKISGPGRGWSARPLTLFQPSCAPTICKVWAPQLCPLSL